MPSPLITDSVGARELADARSHEHTPTPAETPSSKAAASAASAKPASKAAAEPARPSGAEAASTCSSKATTAGSCVRATEGAQTHVWPKLARRRHLVPKPVAPFRVGNAHASERVTTARATGETWASRAVGPNGVPASAGRVGRVGNLTAALAAATCEQRVVEVDHHATARVGAAHASQWVEVAVTYRCGWDGAGTSERVDQRRGDAGPGRLGPGRVVRRRARAATLIRTSRRR